MTENVNTGDDTLDNPTKNESKNLSDQNTSSIELEDITPKEETENMETHAHHLHKVPGTGWTHYLFEFLMLFLAVTAGFFVENWRERYVEQKREEQFIKTLVEDLKSDTAQLSSTLGFRIRKETMVDSLAAIMKLPDRNKYGNEVYYFVRNLSRSIFFLPNDRTIQQLKNSGSLRLIHDINVSNRIMTYDQQFRHLSIQYDIERGIIDHFRETEKGILDGQVLLSMIDNINVYDIQRPLNNPQLLKQDKESINELIVEAQFVKSILNFNRRKEEDLKETAQQLMAFIKKEYHLE